MGGGNHHGGVGAPGSAADGNNFLPVRDQPGVQGHTRDLHAHLDPVAQHAQRLGHDFRGVNSSELVANGPVHTSQQVGGKEYPNAVLV